MYLFIYNIIYIYHQIYIYNIIKLYNYIIYIIRYTYMAVYDTDRGTDMGRFVQCIGRLRRFPQRLSLKHPNFTQRSQGSVSKVAKISECQTVNFSGAVNTCRKKPHGPFAMSPIGSKAMKMCTAPRSLKNLCYHRLCIWMYLICFLALICKILFCVCLFNKELGFVSCIRCSVLLGICARTMTLEPCLASWRAGFWQCSMLIIFLEALPRYSLDIPWYAYSRYAFRLVLEVHVWSCVSVTVWHDRAFCPNLWNKVLLEHVDGAESCSKISIPILKLSMSRRMSQIRLWRSARTSLRNHAKPRCAMQKGSVRRLFPAFLF